MSEGVEPFAGEVGELARAALPSPCASRWALMMAEGTLAEQTGHSTYRDEAGGGAARLRLRGGIVGGCGEPARARRGGSSSAVSAASAGKP